MGVVLCRIYSVSEDVLNFILEFTNWKRLPPAVERDLSDYKEKFSWTPKSHFGKQNNWKNKSLCILISRI